MKLIRRALAALILALAIIAVGVAPAALAATFTISAEQPPGIQIPSIPIGIIVLLGLVSPYVIALINRPTWSATQKKIVAVVTTLVLAGAVLAFYYWATGEPLPSWPALILLAIVVSQATYTLLAKDLGAAALERATSPKP